MNEAREADEARWWDAFYDRWLSAILLEQTGEDEIVATLDFLVEVLTLEPGARVFDQCCGIGRLALPLAQRGFEVVGIDQAQGYIERARRCAAEDGLDAGFAAADAFDYVVSPPCDGALNWWTSFGYTLDDARNLEMLRRALESVVPGGRFALDVPNIAGILGDFRPTVVDRVETDDGGLLLLRESRYDAARGAMLKTWTYVVPDGRRVVHDSVVRMYTPPELRRLLEEAGFEKIAFFGDVDASALDVDSRRCIAVAHRPHS